MLSKEEWLQLLTGLMLCFRNGRDKNSNVESSSFEVSVLSMTCCSQCFDLVDMRTFGLSLRSQREWHTSLPASYLVGSSIEVSWSDPPSKEERISDQR